MIDGLEHFLRNVDRELKLVAPHLAVFLSLDVSSVIAEQSKIVETGKEPRRKNYARAEGGDSRATRATRAAPGSLAGHRT